MKILYTTDLHGDEYKYQRVLQHAIHNDFKTVHIGADLLPKGSGLLKIQKKFIKGFFREWCQEAWSHEIIVMASFGNDDLHSRKKYVKEIGLSLLEETRVIDCQENIKFKAYPWVPVHPFGLLNGCKIDRPIDFGNLPMFKNRPTDLDAQGRLEFVQDVEEHLKARRSIEEDLENFESDNRTIVSIHSPPAGLGLDVCHDGRKVGSMAIRNWVETHETMLILCGHIHESPQRTGVWKAQATNGVWVVQPGQYGNDVIAVEINTENLDAMERISL